MNIRTYHRVKVRRKNRMHIADVDTNGENGLEEKKYASLIQVIYGQYEVS